MVTPEAPRRADAELVAQEAAAVGFCAAIDPGELPFVCSLRARHEPPHTALGPDDEVLAQW